MLVLYPLVQPLTRSHCSHCLLHYCLRYLLHSPGSCSGSRRPMRLTLSPGLLRSMSGSMAACPEWGVAEVSEAPGWSRFRCRSQVSLNPQVPTLLLQAQTARRVSGQKESTSSYGSHLGPRNLVWSWQEEMCSSWHQTQPSLWDRCLQRSSYCWWDWQMLWMPEMIKKIKNIFLPQLSSYRFKWDLKGHQYVWSQTAAN